MFKPDKLFFVVSDRVLFDFFCNVYGLFFCIYLTFSSLFFCLYFVGCIYLRRNVTQRFASVCSNQCSCLSFCLKSRLKINLTV